MEIEGVVEVRGFVLHVLSAEVSEELLSDDVVAVLISFHNCFLLRSIQHFRAIN